jgi:hypothetical protein
LKTVAASIRTFTVAPARAIAIAFALCGSACGNGTVPGTTYDQPLLSLQGTISPTGGLVNAKHPIIAFLWTDPLQRQPDVVMPARWLQSSVNAIDDTFRVQIFRPPPPEALVSVASSSKGGEISRLAIGEIVIVDDRNGDGTFQIHGPRATIASPDSYLAGSAEVLTFVETPFPSTQLNSPLTLPGQSGYALVNYYCQGQLSAGTHPTRLDHLEMILHPSPDFPNARTCRASHGP